MTVHHHVLAGPASVAGRNDHPPPRAEERRP
jgi:hypothetical protein